MINITIQTEVPHFFINLHLASIKQQHKLGSIEDFLKSKCSEDFYNEYQWLIEKSIEFRMSTGVCHIPITQTTSNNRFTLICKDYAVAFVPNLNVVLDFRDNSFVVKKIDLHEIPLYYTKDMTNHLNLIDGVYYEGHSTNRLSKTAVEKYDSIYNDFIKLNNFQPFIDWFNNGQPLQEYFDQLSNVENSIELELYNRWILHNINLTK